MMSAFVPAAVGASLPTHPLIVHLPIVVVPLAALGAVLLALLPSWRARFGPVVAVLASAGVLGALLAAHSGEELESRVDRTALVVRHAELGREARLLSVVFLFAVLAFVLYERSSVDPGPTASGSAKAAGKPIATVLAVIMVLVGAVASASMLRAGHKGAEAVWHELGPSAGN